MANTSEKKEIQWWKFLALKQNDQWLEPAYIACDKAGIITKIQSTAPAAPCKMVEGIAIPGFINGHSHAFQFAMAGLAEFLSPNNPMDDFWTWREAMYDLALKISPEDVEAIATQAYMELLCEGYTHVVEFHYLHNDLKGNPYANRAELAERHIVAALRAGIRLTIIPVYYREGDFQTPAEPKQKRFLSKSPDDYFSILEATEKAIRQANQSIFPAVQAGMGIHSLRAASPKDIFTILQEHSEGIPFHLHIAEQRREVERSIEILGASPISWAIKNIVPHFSRPSDLSFVHATHSTKEEAFALAEENINIILCPSTEGNLGDGFFPLKSFVRGGGKFTIGSDSHIGISPLEEIRWLDYVQRLRKEKRNTLCFTANEDSGEKIFRSVMEAGRRSAGIKENENFVVGKPLDAVIIDSALLATTSAARKTSTLVFATTPSSIRGVIMNGKWIVENGIHVHADSIRRNFFSVIQKLGNRLA